jgi:effector-binding domain-containing protein
MKGGAMKRVVVMLLFLGVLAGGIYAEPEMPTFTKTTEFMRVAFISYQGSFEKIPAVMEKLDKWIDDNGYTPVGPPIGVYFDDPSQVPQDSLRWEVEQSIAEAAEERQYTDDIGIKTVEPMFVAVTYHKGAYEKVGKVYGALFAWIGENGYQVVGAPREIYWKCPKTTPEENLLAEVQIPVSAKPAEE